MAKYSFHENYLGPIGPHLNCLTQWSRTREESKANTSIHPRVIGGTTLREKSNTASKKRRSTIDRKIDSLRAHMERHPTDMVADGKLKIAEGVN